MSVTIATADDFNNGPTRDDPLESWGEICRPFGDWQQGSHNWQLRCVKDAELLIIGDSQIKYGITTKKNNIILL